MTKILKVLCVPFVLLASLASAQVPCNLPPPTTVSLNPTHVYADLFDLAQVEAFDVAYFDSGTLVQGPSTILKTAWTPVSGTCHKAALPLQVPATGSFAAKVRTRQGATVGAWSEPSHLFGNTPPAPVPPTASGLTIGPAELLYTDAQMPFTMDATFATLAQSATTTAFFVKDYPNDAKYIGPLDKPLLTRVPGNAWNMQGASGMPWLPNLYQIDTTGRLLGFVHKEIGVGTPGVTFTIGLGYSINNGDTWTYLGDIIAPQDRRMNVGGVPYLVVGPYFYVYFNEGPTNTYTTQKRLSVARALVADVLQAAALGTVTPWMKFNNGAWTQPGLTGLGSNIIPDWNPTYTDWQQTYDMHSDAAYNTVLQKYLLTVQTHNRGELLLYVSDDGVTWGSRTVVDSGPTTIQQPYSTFVGLAGATADSREVGAEFYIFYPRKHFPGNYNIDDLYRRKVTVGDPPPPPPPPPPLGDSYQAAADFTLTQGPSWFYRDSTGPMGTLLTSGPVVADHGPTWRGSEAFVLLWADGGHPGAGTDAVRRWTAPRGSTARITGVARDTDSGGGDGVVVSIRHGAATIWQATIINGDTTGVAFDVTVVVQAGDTLDFGINRRATNAFDSTSFNPTITLTTSPQPGCTYVLSPATAQAFSAAGGTRNIGVTTADGCAWTVSSDAAWLTTTTPTGTGTDDAIYVVAPNTTPVVRIATLTVQGQAVTVTQEALVPPTCAVAGPTVVIENITRTITLGTRGLVTVRVQSVSGRKIAYILVGFTAPSTFTKKVGTGDVGEVNRFWFTPPTAGTYGAYVEAEDEAGCVTRKTFTPTITVVP